MRSVWATSNAGKRTWLPVDERGLGLGTELEAPFSKPKVIRWYYKWLVCANRYQEIKEREEKEMIGGTDVEELLDAQSPQMSGTAFSRVPNRCRARPAAGRRIANSSL